MSAVTESNLGLNYGWAYGESGWNTGMDDNLVKLGFTSRNQVKGILSAPPSTPSNGDAYIVGTSPTGLFSGNFGKVAIWDRTVWLFLTPKNHEVVYNVADGCDYKYDNGWSLKQEDELSPYVKVKDFTFSTGYTITDQKQCLLNLADNKYYQWFGALPKVVPASSTPATAGGIGELLWVDRTDLMLRQILSGSHGDANVAHTQASSATSRTVEQKIEVFSSLEDYGESKTEFGMNSTVEATVLSDTTNVDEDFLLPRNLSVAKELYGIRRNACVQSIRANSGNSGFNAQITGVTSTQGLADYGSVDNVSLFTDITNTPYSAWEVVDTPSYSSNGFTATGLDFTKMKKGMVVRTLHPTPFWGFITSISSSTDTVNVIEWRKTGSTSSETPAAGHGLVINPVDKLWAANFNVELPLGSRCQNAAVAEYGIINNNNADPTSMNILDLLILGQSTYGVTSAVFAHSASAGKFYAPFIARNSTFAAYLADEDNHRGFFAVDSTFGHVYASNVPNGSKYSFCVKVNSNGMNDDLRMAFDDLGRACRVPEKVGVAANGVPLTFGAKRWINASASAVSTALPTNPTLQDGDILKLHCTNPASGLWTVTATNILPHGGNSIVSSATLTEGVYDAVYIGGTWYINK